MTHMFLKEGQESRPTLHVERAVNGDAIYGGVIPICSNVTDAVLKQARRTIGRIDTVQPVPEPLEVIGGIEGDDQKPARLLVQSSKLMPIFGEITATTGMLIADTERESHAYVDAHLSYCLGQLGGMYESPNPSIDRHIIELNVDNPPCAKGRTAFDYRRA